ncbi:hypothetical protein CEXT_329641 [Caerostris extrusa]|uniref:Uncharacterized protein n=1 Tax=Caerostris extrusa TaxID=172846 RepID=A0AAV4XPP9_CAEEX|nr:hypothetical protein CEXT_329641 [Caerostris extrusa]
MLMTDSVVKRVFRTIGGDSHPFSSGKGEKNRLTAFQVEVIMNGGLESYPRAPAQQILPVQHREVAERESRCCPAPRHGDIQDVVGPRGKPEGGAIDFF